MSSRTFVTAERRIDDQKVGHRSQLGNGSQILGEIEREIGRERGVDGVGGCAQEQRVAVGGRADDEFGRDVAAGSRLVLDNELLARRLAELWHQQADEHISRRSRSKAANDAHGLGRVILRCRHLERKHAQENSADRDCRLPQGAHIASSMTMTKNFMVSGSQLIPLRWLRSPRGNLDWRGRARCTACCRAGDRQNRSAKYFAPSAHRADCRCRS